jgi:hypothetical protein
MKKITIYLDTFDKIKKYLNISYRLDYDLKLISGIYIVDGKSIMGIFGLDLTKPIIVDMLNNKNIYPKELEEFMIKVA